MDYRRMGAYGSYPAQWAQNTAEGGTFSRSARKSAHIGSTHNTQPRRPLPHLARNNHFGAPSERLTAPKSRYRGTAADNEATEGWTRRPKDALAGRSAPRTAVASASVSRRTQLGPHMAVPRRGLSLDGRYYLDGDVLKPIQSDEELEEDEDVEDDEPFIQDEVYPLRFRKAARKVDLPIKTAGKAARKLEQTAAKTVIKRMEPTVIYISSDSEDSDPEEPPESEDDDVSELLDAFEPLSISARLRSHRSLPFLVRNLRKSFLSHCQAKGISTGPKTVPTRRLRMVYKYFVGDDEVNATEEDWAEHSGSSTEWICAFCDLHGAFNTRELLEYHLSNDHKEVETTWENKDGQWQVCVKLKADSNGSEGGDEDSEDDRDEVIAPGPTSEVGTPIQYSPHTSPSATVVPSTPPMAASALPPQFPVSPQIKHKKEREEQERLFPLLPSHVDDPQPCTGITDEGILIPPSKEERGGPAAQYPYLKAGWRSCRIDGPRLYDLLNELPLEPFGVLAWSIVDTEEELFELEDMRDEDKVIFALWNRWIMLNRVQFVFGEGYLPGVKKFMDEYYQMIHRAAGYTALKVFLLLFKTNRFLTLVQVAEALRYYEEKVDMKNWYDDCQTP